MQKRPRLHVYYNWQIYPDKHVHLVRCGPILCHWCLLVVCYRPNVGPTEVTTRVDLVSFSKIPYLDRFRKQKPKPGLTAAAINSTAVKKHINILVMHFAWSSTR